MKCALLDCSFFKGLGVQRIEILAHFHGRILNLAKKKWQRVAEIHKSLQ
ncbi:MAG: hypothetical protein VSS75_018075 [Candidatus Parabeggiatoa sp.]|nr:hypothetical protein [Candidatus Parabeggiatoa sp.]